MSKRSSASIFDYFTKKLKVQTTSVVDQNISEEIPLVEFNRAADCQNSSNETSSTIEISIHSSTLSRSNMNKQLQKGDEPVCQSIHIDSSGKH